MSLPALYYPTFPLQATHVNVSIKLSGCPRWVSKHKYTFFCGIAYFSKSAPNGTIRLTIISTLLLNNQLTPKIVTVLKSDY